MGSWRGVVSMDLGSRGKNTTDPKEKDRRNRRALDIVCTDDFGISICSGAKRMRWNRICAVAALLTAFFVVVPTLVIGALTPGYRHASQFISELGATGAPHARAMNVLGFLPAGLAALLFVVAAWKVFPRSRAWALGLVGLVAYALGYLVAVWFPCDLGCRPEQPSMSQIVHNIGGLLGYGLAPVTMTALWFATRRWKDARALSRAAAVGAVLSLLGLLTLSPESPWVGISQRVIELTVLGWIVLCGLRALREPRARTD